MVRLPIISNTTNSALLLRTVYMHRLNNTDHSKLLKRKSRRVLQKQPVMLRIVNSWLSTKVPNTNDKWLKILMFSRVATLSDQPIKIILCFNVIIPMLCGMCMKGGMAFNIISVRPRLFKSLWWWTYIFFYVQSNCMCAFFCTSLSVSIVHFFHIESSL